MNTNKSIRMTLALAAAGALIAPAKLQAQTWQTVLDYQLAPGQPADGDGIVADAFGNVFSAGNANDTSSVAHGITLKTDSTQASWFLSDDTNPSAAQYKSVIWNLGIDPVGSLYSIGQLTPNSTGIPYWHILKSADSGVTWSTMDLYQYAAGQWIDATGFAADNLGNIYVVGWGRDAGTRKNPSGNIHWLVRKSGDGGQNWALVDDVIGPTANGAGIVPGAGVFVVGGRFNGTSSWLVRRSASGALGTWASVDGPFDRGAARAVCSDSQGNIYVAGSTFITTQAATKHTAAQGYYAWVTRKSSDGGNTWATADTFVYAPAMQSDAWGIGRNAAGDVVVVGKASDAQNKGHWIVRALGPVGWQTVDDFQLAQGYGAVATSTVSDASGNLLVTGNASDASGSHWIVRRLTL